MMPSQILVVDDDIHILDILAYEIRHLGYALYKASSGREALEIINAPRNAPIELVLTDIWMPGMSGIELLQTLHETRPTLPVAVITGAATLESSIDALNMGAFAYLRKPFQSKQIQEVITRGLNRAQELKQLETLERELKARYQQLEHVQQQLIILQESQKQALATSASDALADLITGLRHELGNVTTAITLNLSVMQEQGNLPSDLHEHIEDLQTSADYLVSLVSKLTEYPRLDSTARPLDLRRIINGAISTVQGKLASKNIQLIYDIPEYRLGIYGSPLQLKRALVHLLENAIEAVQPNQGCIQVQTTFTQSTVAVTIEDNGPGLPAAGVAKVFSPGYTTKITDGFMRGLGFGLFLAQATLEVHGGNLKLENRPQGGTRVRLELPIFGVKKVPCKG